MRQRVDMRIDTELLKQVDEARGTKTRTAFVEDALKAHLYLEPEPNSVAAKKPKVYFGGARSGKSVPEQPPLTRSERIAQLTDELRSAGLGTYAAKDEAARRIEEEG